jgi:hypothetical protein
MEAEARDRWRGRAMALGGAGQNARKIAGLLAYARLDGAIHFRFFPLFAF